MSLERWKILGRALDHYYFKLSDIAKSEDYLSPSPASIVLNQDLNVNMNKIRDILSILKSPEHPSELLFRHRNIICFALVNYISDLQKLRKKVNEKLEEASASLERTEKEISLAEQARSEMCV